jgi:hypothetical protein
MTLNQAIRQAKQVSVTIHPSGVNLSQLKISKAQAIKMLKDNLFDLMNPVGDECDGCDEVLWYGNFQGEIVAQYDKRHNELILGA